jgi:uncharacterized protein (DUF1684 family)
MLARRLVSSFHVSFVVMWLAVSMLTCAVSRSHAGDAATDTATKAATMTAVPDEYAAEIDAWSKRRLERLTSDTGYLALAGLFWLSEGENTFGTDPSNDFVFLSGPAHAGVFVLENGVTRVRANPGTVLELNDTKVLDTVLRTDHDPDTDVVKMGKASFYVIQRGNRYGIRMRDLDSPIRRDFKGIERFPLSPAHRVEARFEPYDPPKRIPIVDVVGSVDTMLCPGAFVFDIDGKACRLDPVVDSPDDDSYWLIFSDATAGEETYGGGRFLYTDKPVDGKVVVDFNKAYNPPCAFSPYTTCPIPPQQNRLDVAVAAGEKKYAGK